MHQPFDSVEIMGLVEWGAFFKNHSLVKRWNERMGTVLTMHTGMHGDRLLTNQIPARLPYRLAADRQSMEVDAVFADMCRKEQALAIFSPR